LPVVSSRSNNNRAAVVFKKRASPGRRRRFVALPGSSAEININRLPAPVESSGLSSILAQDSRIPCLAGAATWIAGMKANPSIAGVREGHSLPANLFRAPGDRVELRFAIQKSPACKFIAGLPQLSTQIAP